MTNAPENHVAPEPMALARPAPSVAGQTGALGLAPGWASGKPTKFPRRTEEQKRRRREYESTPEYKEKKRVADERWRRKRGIKPFGVRRGEYIERIRKPEVREKVRSIMLSKRDKHEAALVWSLRSPDGVVYRFKNLACFIREHRELFTPEQLTPVNRLGRTRIEASLSLLSPRRKHCSHVAHGWTWHIDGKEPETYLGFSPNVADDRRAPPHH